MVQIIEDNDLIKVVMKRVGASGQISIGSEFAGIPVIAYVVLDNRNYKKDEMNNKEQTDAGT